jgi:hypothetical protein
MGNIHFLNQFDEAINDRVVELSSLRGQLILITEKGRIFSMETSTVDTILLHPHFEEIKLPFTSKI